MSRCLAERSIDHVVLERGEVAHTWRTERWDSLRLLTPNWQSRLPGFGYRGPDPDGYRTLPEVIDFITAYAQAISAPVRPHTRVTSVRRAEAGYLVRTDQGDWSCRTVVIASGAFNIACVPGVADHVPRSVTTFTTQQYRNPDQLPDGGVLVVGASSSGTQIANEIHRSGRPVTLSVGEHIRAPRVYRGKDLEWWMDAAGILDERYDQVDDIGRARRVPSLQLAGTPDRSTLDLNALTGIGVRLVGRLAGITGSGKAQFAGSLRNMCALSDLKMNRLLNLIDEWAQTNGFDGRSSRRTGCRRPRSRKPRRLLWISPMERSGRSFGPPAIAPTIPGSSCPFSIARAMVRHDGGVVSSSGRISDGRAIPRRRKSALIDGAGDDARDLSDHLASYLRQNSA